MSTIKKTAITKSTTSSIKTLGATDAATKPRTGKGKNGENNLAPVVVVSTAAKAMFGQVNANSSAPVLIQTPVKKDPKLANHWKTKPLLELTDEDIIAMPDSEYMNEVQLAFFRVKLQNLKQVLRP